MILKGELGDNASASVYGLQISFERNESSVPKLFVPD
jgi:hypothetical protein